MAAKKEEEGIKKKSLFDHVKMITGKQDPKYFDYLSKEDLKTWSNFMIHRFLSMEYDWVEAIADFQPYLQNVKPKYFYLAYIDVLPPPDNGKSRYLRYIKGKAEAKYESWLIELIGREFDCSKRQAIDYCEMLYHTKEGREEIKEICEKYGTEPKLIKKLKLKA